MKKEKKQRLFLIFKILVTIFLLCSFGVFIYQVLKLNVVPTKYLVGGCIGIGLFFLLFLYLLYSKKSIVIKIISIVLLLLCSTGFLYGTKYIVNTYNFIENTKAEYDTLSYSILVLSDSGYNSIDDLKDKNILYLNNDYQEEIKTELNKKITYKENLKEEFGSVIDGLLNGENDAIVLEESYITIVKDEMDDFESRTKVIYTFDVREKFHIENEEQKENITITMEPFILYISGIDQWGNRVSTRGRSDVNQLAVVNPKTNHILLVNTPRDYYVQLAGTTGLRDKLTHAGIYGVEKSIKTLENLYDIDISHYLRVNFNTVVQVVDVIGGIDINSDQAFKPRHGKEYVVKGWNHFDGAMALAYARERYAYKTGDHHRGANQQQVITAILEKVTKSSVLISKYNSILSTLNGSFNTDMSTSEITSFIKYQLDKMPSWKIDTFAVTGSGSMDYTYSMGSKYKLYVMEPNMNTVNTAKAKINEVLNEK